MATRLKVGAVTYLNTKPLVFRLQHFAPQAELIFDLPSRLADKLSAGQLDVALIPSVEYFQNSSYKIVSDACIACRGSVLSVKLFCRVPATQIRSLALDEGSRTSAALTRILLQGAVRHRTAARATAHRPAAERSYCRRGVDDRRSCNPFPGGFFCRSVGSWRSMVPLGQFTLRLCYVGRRQQGQRGRVRPALAESARLWRRQFGNDRRK